MNVGRCCKLSMSLYAVFHNDHAAKECILVERMIKSAGWEAPGGGQLW